MILGRHRKTRFLNSLRTSCPPDHGWSYVTNDKSREWSGSLSFKQFKNTSDLSDDSFSHKLIFNSTPVTTTSDRKPLVNVNRTTIVALNTRKTDSIDEMDDKPITAKPEVIKYENTTKLSLAKSKQATIETTARSEITAKVPGKETTTTVKNFTTLPLRDVRPVRCPERLYLSGTSSFHER